MLDNSTAARVLIHQQMHVITPDKVVSLLLLGTLDHAIDGLDPVHMDSNPCTCMKQLGELAAWP